MSTTSTSAASMQKEQPVRGWNATIAVSMSNYD